MLLAVGGFVAALCVVELAVRIATHSLFIWQNMDSDSYVVSDPLVGRLPRPGVSLHHPKGYTITIGDNGTRRNGDTPLPASRPLALAVGDSFTFGDGVNDDESWPAILEQLSGAPVVNAGMGGFGLDQAVLRAERLVEVYHPDIIIVSFIPHDVLRCEMSYWSGFPKPYFDLGSSGLRLHPAPAAPRSAFAPLKKVISWSMAAELAFSTSLHWQGPEVLRVHDQGRQVACRLMERLAALGRAHHARIIILAQPQQPSATSEQVEIKNGVLACAVANDLAVVDLFPVIDRLPLDQRERLFPRHMSVEGNRIVATEVTKLLLSGADQRGGATH